MTDRSRRPAARPAGKPAPAGRPAPTIPSPTPAPAANAGNAADEDELLDVEPLDGAGDDGDGEVDAAADAPAGSAAPGDGTVDDAGDAAMPGLRPGLTPERRRWRLRRTLPDRRLDKYLADRLTHLSRTTVTRLIREGHVTVNGRAAKPSHEPTAGDVVELVCPPAPQTDLQPETMPLDIVFEDEHMLVLDKRAGVAVHPSRGTWSGTLVNGLLAYVRTLSNYHEDKLRPGVVHRLDKHTTGLIVFAKTEEAHWRLAVQWENRTVEKEYLALVEGSPTLQSDWIDAPIGKHPTAREKYAVRAEGGKHALTYWEIAERFDGFALLKCGLHTGRTHQIRVHLQHAGLPIVSDEVYGRRRELWLGDVRRGPGTGLVTDEVLISRQALHAWRLKLMHPISRKTMEFQAEPAADIRRTLAALREHRAV